MLDYVSQKGQDRWIIEEIFPDLRNGWFVDLAATDGVSINNTVILEKTLGWTGVAIEADPAFFPLLAASRTCKCVQACIDEVERDVEFLSNGELGGILDDDTDNRPSIRQSLIDERRSGGATFHTRTRTLADVLDEAQAPSTIEYLSLDVEGAETRIMRAFPFHRYRFLAATIERPTPELNRLLFDAGYVPVRNVTFDTFYVHETIPRLDAIAKEPFAQVPPKEW